MITTTEILDALAGLSDDDPKLAHALLLRLLDGDSTSLAMGVVEEVVQESGARADLIEEGRPAFPDGIARLGTWVRLNGVVGQVFWRGQDRARRRRVGIKLFVNETHDPPTWGSSDDCKTVSMQAVETAKRTARAARSKRLRGRGQRQA